MALDKQEYNRQYYLNNQHRVYPSQTKSALKEQRLKRRYNLTLEEYEKMLIQQENKCVICNSDFDDTTASTRAQVDHDHITGKVRALLCIPCNTTLGKFSERSKTLENAIKYLQEFKLNEEVTKVLEICESHQVHFSSALAEYSEYVEQQMSTIFNFEDWIAQTHPEIKLSELKWRTLKV